MSKVIDDLRALGFPELANAWEESQKDQPQMRVFRNHSPVKSFKEKPRFQVLTGGLCPIEIEETHVCEK